MDKKILIVILAIVAVVAIGTIALAISEETTEIESNFIKAEIPGTVVEVNEEVTLVGWEMSYFDENDGTRFSFLMLEDMNFFMETFLAMGAEKLGTKTYNGVNWDIYYADSSVINDLSSDDIINPGYICVASGEKGDYYIEVTHDISKDGGSLDSDVFINKVEPVLQTAVLKEPENPPKLFEFLEMSESELDNLKSYIETNGWDILKNQSI